MRNHIKVFADRDDSWMGWFIATTVISGVDALSSLVALADFGSHNLYLTGGFAVPSVVFAILTLTSVTWGVHGDCRRSLAYNISTLPKDMRKEIALRNSDINNMTEAEAWELDNKLEVARAAYIALRKSNHSQQYLDSIIATHKEMKELS